MTTSAASGAWVTYQHDAARSGVDPDQPAVTSAAFDWSLTLDGQIFAQPLVVGNTVIAATQNDSLYAIDATSHAVLWRASLGTAATSGLPGGCGDPSSPVGVLGTPVIDASNGIVYAAALTEPNGPSNLQYILAALNLSDGSIRYSVPINPTNRSGQPTFDASIQDQRSALTLSQGRVYVEFGGLSGDCDNYRGWVWAANASDGSSPLSYETPAAASGASIWAPPGGSIDASGNLFVPTGNSQQESTPDHSESVIKLSPTLQELGFFTASNWASLNSTDTDIGSFGPVQLTTSQFSQYNGLVFQAGKNGQGYIINGANPGGVGGQVFTASVCGQPIMGGGVYVPPTLYVGCTGSLQAIHFSTSGSPSFTSSTLRGGYSGGLASGAQTPIWSGGWLWNLDIGARHLVMTDPSSGQGQTFTLTGQPVHFASPASGASHIFAPAGSDLDAYRLTSAAPPTATPTNTPIVNTATPTPTRTAVPTATNTPPPASTSTPTPTPTPNVGTSGFQTITFDDLSSPNRPLNGQYPAGVIDWGTGAWWLSGPWGQFSTNSVSFNGGGPTSATFTFVSPSQFAQFDVYNGGSGSSTVSASCAGQPTVSRSVAAGQMVTIATGWSGTCSSVTLGSSNGWWTNFDNLQVSSSGGSNPTPTPTATATPVPTVTVTFDDLSSPNRSLNGQYPSGVIDWGTGGWYLSGPYASDTTNSISFNGDGPTSEAFTFVSSHRLLQLDAYNGGSGATTVTVACSGQSTVSVTLGAGQRTTIATNWSGPCTSVTVGSSNGWWTNFDNLVVQ